MTDEEINKAIVEICGICNSDEHGLLYKTNTGWVRDCPDYCNDLNAMHEAESILTEKQKRTFALILSQVLDTSPTVDLGDQFLNIHATAKQRAQAFLRTLGKWKETK